MNKFIYKLLQRNDIEYINKENPNDLIKLLKEDYKDIKWDKPVE